MVFQVNGEDIRNASHAKAVEVIKNAINPVTFIVQSLVPLVSYDALKLNYTIKFGYFDAWSCKQKN